MPPPQTSRRKRSRRAARGLRLLSIAAITRSNKLIQIPLILLVIQMILTYCFTNTKHFSIQAYIMNVAWAFGIYLTYKTKKLKFLLVPIILRFLFLIINLSFGNIPPYITTEYLYSDFFENVNKRCKCNEYYTEGDYNGLLPFNTLDKNSEIKINDWGAKMYNKAVNDPKNNIFNDELMKKSKFNKYKWIVQNLGISSNSKVLEMGFGKMDLMKYIRDNTGATVEGTNISLEQINQAKKEGFKCYQINHEDIGDNIDILGKYDAIITDGTLEYLVNTSDSYNKFKNFSDNIHKLLLPGGKWFTATIHFSNQFMENKKRILKSYLWPDLIKFYLQNDDTFMNIYNLYYLALGNEGCYPFGKDGLTKYTKNKLDVILQQDRTIDYALYSFNWMICQMNKKSNDSLSEKVKRNFKHLICFFVAPLYDASYICYNPPSNWRYQPWLWQFLRQKNGHRPVDHYWIIFQKKKE